MKILVVNCGSSSLKYQFIDMENESILCKGLVERIGIDGSRIKHDTTGKERVVVEEDMKDHKIALKQVLEIIVHPEHGAIASMDEIDAIGHRVVHGGENFASSAIIDEKVMDAIKECIEIAPLHNPPNIIGIEACRELMPEVKMVAVFDTAFHQTMPKEAYIYPIPYEYYEKYRIRKYGFHGTSHGYVAQRAASLLNKDINSTNVITCHLGNGASITAVKNGKSIDTSMGFTPLAGVTMGTRSGDIDPAIIGYIMDKENLSISEINNILNKKSGVLGISGLSSDFRDLEESMDKNERSKLALEIFVSRVKNYIGAYFTQLGRVDAIVFTAGIGENSDIIREWVCRDMEALGIKIDVEANKVRAIEKIVSTEDSAVKVMIIPTNEELMIARDTKELVSKS